MITIYDPVLIEHSYCWRCCLLIDRELEEQSEVLIVVANGLCGSQ